MFHVFLDRGRPATGIVDALVVQLSNEDRDQLLIGFVQLKAGTAALSPGERTRLIRACRKFKVLPLAAFWDVDADEVGADWITVP